MSRPHPKPNILVSQHLGVISPLFEIRMHVGLYENIIQEVEAWDIDVARRSRARILLLAIM